VPLRALALRPLPLGSIRPAGWLAGQLRLQADGLSGHLDEFWPDVAQSGWIGGSAEGWERGPYWLDGVVPLAFLLDDGALKAKVGRWVEYILAHQGEDGWLGPIRGHSLEHRYAAYDPWPSFVVLKAFTQLQEATGEARVMPAMKRFARRLAALLGESPLCEWGKFRWADLVLSLHWLYERTAEPWLLELAAAAHRQGYDWKGHFARFRYREKTPRGQVELPTHVVNSAMAIKASGVWYRQSGREEDRRAVYEAMETLDAYHGQATGMFSGDEHYAGRDPSQGTELCAVVEYLFSLEVLLSVLGDACFADRLERIAFNALPGTFSPDMWSHQYDQQANQVICCVAEDRVYTSNGPDANIFGLQPNYGCCTANLSQGWPKLASHLWMATPEGGLAAVSYAPCVVSTELSGVPVRVEVETGYPFEQTLRLRVRTARPLRFPLHLRVPAWGQGAELEIRGEGVQALPPGGFHAVAREWSGESVLTLSLPMRITAQRRYHGSVSLQRGPLLYALRIGERWRLIGGEPPHGDWEVHPTTPWNYALQLDPERPGEGVELESRPVGERPFSPEGAPLLMRVTGRRLPEWTLRHNAAGPLPQSPVRSRSRRERLTLIPYGCTNLRVTEFPLLG
jgi:DUF1680 family protein